MLEVRATVNEKVTSDPMSETSASMLAFQTKGKLNPVGDDKFTVTYVQPKDYVDAIPYTSDLRTKIAEKLPEMDQYYNDLGVIRKEQPSIQELEQKYKKQREDKYGVSGVTRFTVNGKVFDIPKDKVEAFKLKYPDAK
jgi:hypothetical protein